ncbi:MAG TPA: hypothetical protein VH520_08325 [Streptosporangiaceae bacterium]
MGQRMRAVRLARTATPQPVQAARPAPPDFLPSRHGFGFANSWPPVPAISIRTPAGRLGIGNAALGLCGGMVFAALDYWHAGGMPSTAQPAPGTPLFRFVVRRLIDSWHIPAGVAAYYRGMLSSDAALTNRTISRQWPRIRALLDAGQPAPVGLVTVASANPLLLGHNHQVLAYGYAVSGQEVTLAVYDPNSGPDDSVVVRFSSTGFAHNVSIGWPVRGFFLTRYRPARPPGG